jgi:hypothetical protein
MNLPELLAVLSRLETEPLTPAADADTAQQIWAQLTAGDDTPAGSIAAARQLRNRLTVVLDRVAARLQPALAATRALIPPPGTIPTAGLSIRFISQMDSAGNPLSKVYAVALIDPAPGSFGPGALDSVLPPAECYQIAGKPALVLGAAAGGVPPDYVIPADVVRLTRQSRQAQLAAEAKARADEEQARHLAWVRATEAEAARDPLRRLQNLERLVVALADAAAKSEAMPGRQPPVIVTKAP